MSTGNCNGEDSVKIPPVQHVAEGRCHFYMAQKHRFCKQKAVAVRNGHSNGTLYCLYHAMEDSSGNDNERNSERLRVPCPIDPSHSIYQDQIEKHKLICPRTKQLQREQSQVYYKQNLNRGGCGRHEQLPSRGVAAAMGEEEDMLQSNLAARTLQIYQQLFPIPNNSENDADHSKGFSPIESITYEQIYNSILQKDTADTQDAISLYQSFNNQGIKSGGMKHVMQQASIISTVKNLLCTKNYNNTNNKTNNTISNNIMIIDMGAGRGMLGLATAGVINNDFYYCDPAQRVQLLLVERGSSRSKADGKIRRQQELQQQATTLSASHLSESIETYSSTNSPNGTKNAPTTSMDMKVDTLSFCRIRCDLAHVHLQLAIDWALSCNPVNHHRQKMTNVIAENKVGSLNSSNDTDIIVVAKHLCGCGTDYALKSMEVTNRVRKPSTSASTENDTGPTPSSYVSLCVFATCCYGVCNWDDYVGRDTLMELFQGNFSQKEFDTLTRWTTGTVLSCCSSSDGDHHKANINTGKSDNNDRFGRAISQVVQKLNLSCGVHGLGRCCQRIIDYGRVVYIREVLGFPYADVIHFVDESVTPQNALLIGSHSPIRHQNGTFCDHAYDHRRKLVDE
jgi:tRNA:m4X modification enzyme